jgi:hypothetical protein
VHEDRSIKALVIVRQQLADMGGEPEEGFTQAGWMPPVDIEESDKEYLIKAELPGMKKEEVGLKVEGGTLSISGERKAEKEEKDKKYHSKLTSKIRRHRHQCAVLAGLAPASLFGTDGADACVADQPSGARGALQLHAERFAIHGCTPNQ